jgi:mannose-6-phosphate isomerase-like protein (cupin superfamily)
VSSHRRVVTGHDGRGRSVVASDGPPGNERGSLFELWATNAMPADNVDPTDAAAARDVILQPDSNGTIFRFFEVAPEGQLPGVEDRRRRWESQLAAMSADERAAATAQRPDVSRHPAMHRTATVDYVVLLRGEVTMLLDEGEVELKPFDVVVQRGTNHGWINHGDETALLAGVLVDAVPAGSGS